MTTSLILLNDFKRQWADTGADALAAVQRVGESGWYVLGGEVTRFETLLASELGAGFCVGCASGLDAIEIALRALDLQPGTRVLTTPLSAFATTLAIVRAGGIPVFADVDETGNLDLERAAEHLSKRRDITFMVPVHLYGHALDLQRLGQLKTQFGLRVVEDCAQAIGASSGGQLAGSVGDLAAVSFYPTKNLGALGDGGAVFGRDASAKAICESLRNYGQSARYVHDRLGLNSRLDELHAAILAGAFLPKLGAWTKRRREIAARYRDCIRHPEVQSMPAPRAEGSVWHLFPVLVPPARRAAFQAHLQANGVQSAIHYPTLIPDQAALNGVPFEVLGELTRARQIASSVVSLPIHPYLSDDELERVAAAVHAWGPP